MSPRRLPTKLAGAAAAALLFAHTIELAAADPADPGVLPALPPTVASSEPTCDQKLAKLIAATEGVACDAGFKPSGPRGGCCGPGDLACMIAAARRFDHAVEEMAPSVETGACLRECQAGQAASCARIAKTALTFCSVPASEAFHARACELGFAPSCRAPDPASLEAKKAASYATLHDRCDPAEASWACFHLGYLLAEGQGVARDRKAARAQYQRVCKAPCPKGTDRCFRKEACRLAKLR